MKRFHVHIVVENLANSIDFYSKLFGQSPTRQKDDYAKWMLEDPRVNFAISAQGNAVGVNHFGFQVDSSEELRDTRQLAENAASGNVLDQGETSCCYSRSEKHWTIDPQGLAWEHFYTMADATIFGNEPINQKGACCIPVRSTKQDTAITKAACCIPETAANGANACCA